MGILSYLRDWKRVNLPPIVRTEVTVSIEREPLADGTEKVTRTVIETKTVSPTMTLTVNGKPFPRRKS